MGPPTKIEHNGLALQVSHLPYLKVPDVGKNVLFSEMQPCGLDSQSSIVAARKAHVTRDAPCKVKPSCSAAPRRGQKLSVLGLPRFDLPSHCAGVHSVFPGYYLLGFPSGSRGRCHCRKAGLLRGAVPHQTERP